MGLEIIYMAKGGNQALGTKWCFKGLKANRYVDTSNHKTWLLKGILGIRIGIWVEFARFWGLGMGIRELNMDKGGNLNLNNKGNI